MVGHHAILGYILRGCNLIDIQVLLGNKSPETAFTYLHSPGKMLNIKSLLNSL